MKKILNILTGLMFIIGDLISNTYVIVRDAIKLFFTMNRNNNEFVALFARKSFVMDMIVFITIFFVIGHFSVILALVGLFIFYFVWYNFKENWYRSTNEHWEDGAFGAAAGISGVVVVIFSMYLYAVTPFQYKEIGKITIQDSDINYTYSQNGETRKGTRREVDFDFENETSDANIGACKPGVHTIYDQSVQPDWFTFLASDYILSCSGYMKVNKKVEK